MSIIKRTDTKSSLTKRTVIILVAVVSLLILAAGAAAFLLIKNKQPTTDKAKITEQVSADSYTQQGKNIIIDAVVPDGASAADRSAHEQNVANDLIKSGDEKGALARYKKALSFTPNEIELLRKTALLATKLGDPEASRYYRQSFDLMKAAVDKDAGSFPPQSYVSVADMALKVGDTSAAKVYYQKAIDAAKKIPNNEEATAFRDYAQKELAKL